VIENDGLFIACVSFYSCGEKHHDRQSVYEKKRKELSCRAKHRPINWWIEHILEKSEVPSPAESSSSSPSAVFSQAL